MWYERHFYLYVRNASLDKRWNTFDIWWSIVIACSLVLGQSFFENWHHRHSFWRHFRKCGLLLHVAHRNQTIFCFPIWYNFGSCYGRMFDGAILRNSRNILCLFKEGAGLCELLVKRQFPISHKMPWLTALSSRGELTCFRSKLE